jgi:hypothetical protein
VVDNWYTGNANADADAHRDWLVGHFVQPPVLDAAISPPPSDLRAVVARAR